MFYDRTAMLDGRPQRYASQLICKDRKRVLYPMEDPADARRKAMGFALSTAQNLARFDNYPPCVGDYTGPMPKQ